MQSIGPVSPTTGVVQSQPDGTVIDWNVVPTGTVSVNWAGPDASGPSLSTWIV